MPRSKSGRKKQKARQRVAKRYVKAREDAQLAGVIETSPVGAVRDEVVDPASQGFQPLPRVIGEAVSLGWATPEPMKQIQVGELHSIATDPEVEPHVRVAAIRTAQQADKDQWERDNPELAGKTKGGTKVEVNNQQVVQFNALEAAREARVRSERALEEAKKKSLEVSDGRDADHSRVHRPEAGGEVGEAGGAS